MTAFKADGITVQQFNEPAGGQVVFHLHMHVMPRHNGVALLPPASRKEDGKVLEENAAKLMAALKGCLFVIRDDASIEPGFDPCAIASEFALRRAGIGRDYSASTSPVFAAPAA